MFTVKDCIFFEWKNVKLPIHRIEELDYALNHISYYDSPFHSSYDERKAYYGEDWHHYTGEALETLCTLPNEFTPKQKEEFLEDYSELIEYGNSIVTKLECLSISVESFVDHFIGSSIEEGRAYLNQYDLKDETLWCVHSCNESHRNLILYCNTIRNKDRESTEMNIFLQTMQDKYGDIFSLAVQRYKVEECLHQLKTQIQKMPRLKDLL